MKGPAKIAGPGLISVSEERFACLQSRVPLHHVDVEIGGPVGAAEQGSVEFPAIGSESSEFEPQPLLVGGDITLVSIVKLPDLVQ